MNKITQTAQVIGMKYAGERTDYCRFLRHDTINGIHGEWIIHEFGGECFVPFGLIGSPYRNRACFA